MVTLPAAVEVAAISDTGRVREHNEDALWLGNAFARSGFHARRFAGEAIDGLVLAVADGVGGAAAGEVASRFVVEEMADRIAADLSGRGEDPPTAEQLAGIAARVNDELVTQGNRRAGRRGMATTWTGILLTRAMACWMNAGDSRLYRVGEEGLVQVSRDHTLREESGDPSIPGNIITNCFGTPEGFRLDVGSLDPSGSLTLLLCSDGLSDYANMDRVAALLAALPPAPDGEDADASYLEPTAREILDSALAGGGGDNVTLLIVRLIHA